MHRFCLILSLCANSFLSLSQSLNEDSISLLKAKLLAKEAALENYAADVSLVTHSTLFVEPQKIDYLMYYIKPNLFRMEKAEGDREILVFNDEKVYRSVEGGELAELENFKIANAMSEMISKIISGSYLDGNEFKVDYSIVGNHYIISLQPMKRLLAKRIKKIEVVLDVESVGIRELTFYENLHEYFSYKFNSIEYNTEINPSIFTLQ